MPGSSYTDDPPLNSDSRWWSIDVAFERLMVRLRSPTHVRRDLEEVLAQGRLRCMVRSIKTGERKLVLPENWLDRIRLSWWGEKYGVMAVQSENGEPFRGWAFYIWSVDFEMLWPPDPSFPVPVATAPVRFESGWRERQKRVSAMTFPPLLPPLSDLPDNKPEPPKPTSARVRKSKASPRTVRDRRKAEAAERKAQRKVQSDKRIAEVERLLADKPDLNKAESIFFTECKKAETIRALGTLGKREYLQGLKNERKNRREKRRRR